MNIELSIKRYCKKRNLPGSEIQLDDETYFFTPSDGHMESPHVCKIEHGPHIKRLLSIDSYDLFEDDDTSAEELDAFDKLDAQLKKEQIEKEEAEEKQKQAELDKWPDVMDIKVADTEEWPTRRLNQYAVDVMGINPKSKTDIREYAEQYGDHVAIPATMRSPGPMLRALIEGIQDSKRAPEVENDEQAPSTED